MKIRAIGRAWRIGLPAFAFALAFPVYNTALAAEVDRQIPVIRDEAGSDVSVEIQDEGSRSTAHPCVYVANETVERVTDRIGRKIDAWKASNAGAESSATYDGTPEPGASPCSIETLRRRAAGAKVSRAAVPEPGEITVRSAQGFLKGLRASRKQKPAPAVVVTSPEERLGRTDVSVRETN
jgi:hypothetical protein